MTDDSIIEKGGPVHTNAAEVAVDDEAELARMGYKQELKYVGLTCFSSENELTGPSSAGAT